MTPITKQVLAVLTDAATTGKRCPTTDHLGDLVHSKAQAAAALKELTADGTIVIEIAGHNWRVIRLRKGPHAGKSTMPNPDNWPPYRRLDADGDHWLTRQEPT